jgi:hypothetical protein
LPERFAGGAVDRVLACQSVCLHLLHRTNDSSA